MKHFTFTCLILPFNVVNEMGSGCFAYSRKSILSKALLSTYCVPSPVLNTEETQSLSPGVRSPVGDRYDNRQADSILSAECYREAGANSLGASQQRAFSESERPLQNMQHLSWALRMNFIP